MADGSLDTEDVRVIEHTGKTRMFEFRHYVFAQLPLRFVCIDDECTVLYASNCDVGAVIFITSDAIAGLCAYCEDLQASR
jgi:hypothetical protein